MSELFADFTIEKAIDLYVKHGIALNCKDGKVKGLIFETKKEL